MTNKFEQLIEFVINDEEAKAKELFHDIVVEKSREIYENLMNEEEVEELDEESDAERDDHAEKAGKKVAKTSSTTKCTKTWAAMTVMT